MKRIFCILVGAAAAGGLAYLGLGQALHWYEMHRAQGEGDLTRAFVVALVIMVAAMAFGGWLGYWCHRRQRVKPDSAL